MVKPDFGNTVGVIFVRIDLMKFSIGISAPGINRGF